MNPRRMAAIFATALFGASAGLLIGFFYSGLVGAGLGFKHWIDYRAHSWPWPICGFLIGGLGSLAFHFAAEGRKGKVRSRQMSLKPMVAIIGIALLGASAALLFGFRHSEFVDERGGFWYWISYPPDSWYWPTMGFLIAGFGALALDLWRTD